MEKVLFLVHVEEDGGLSKSSLEALKSACLLASSLVGAEFSVGLVGKEVQSAAEKIGGCGASSFLGVAGVQYQQARYASDAQAAETLCLESGATVVVAAQTSRWSRVLGGVAQRLGGRIDSHLTEVESDDGSILVTRWFYRQRMEGKLVRTSRPWILLVEPGSAEPWDGESASVEVRSVSPELPESALRTNVSGVREPETGEQTIRPDAELLFVAGAGWTKKQADGQIHTAQAGELILGLVRQAGASLGSSKSFVDMESEGQGVLPFLSHLNQIGQTGATPRHAKGLATCCHGEEPHVVGWRFVNERRAVNLNPNCGWAQGKADVLYVADAFEVMEKVNALLAAK